MGGEGKEGGEERKTGEEMRKVSEGGGKGAQSSFILSSHSMYEVCCMLKVAVLIADSKSAYEWAARVIACNYVQFESSRNFPPVLKIATHIAQLRVDISHCC